MSKVTIQQRTLNDFTKIDSYAFYVHFIQYTSHLVEIKWQGSCYWKRQLPLSIRYEKYRPSYGYYTRQRFQILIIYLEQLSSKIQFICLIRMNARINVFVSLSIYTVNFHLMQHGRFAVRM
jgi:hypothetical protein